ncbi:hypothetical protein KAX08_03435, partial [candidate division WOR-3 bacterium]|nr:hypothetical protein [candidate division WOR-3 bacterium]
MKISFIKQLIDIVEMSNISEIEITRFFTKIRISKTSLREPNEELISISKKSNRESEKSVKIEEVKKEKKK